MARERTVAVLGLGLIGGSVLRATLARGVAARVRGWDAAPAAMEAVRRAGFGESLAGTLEDACAGASLVLVSVPARAIPALVDRARRLPLAPGGVVTDTGSTKVWVADEVLRLERAQSPEGAPRPGWDGGDAGRPLAPYVGGHPIAGVERSGFEAGSARLFEGQTWAVTALVGAAEGPVEAVASFARDLGASPLVVSAAEHDRRLALTSHLPYVLAASLTALAARDRECASAAGSEPAARVAALAPFAAGGFRDATRLALQDPKMGQDMLATNRPEITEALRELVTLAGELLAGLDEDGSAGARGLLDRANALRAGLGRLKGWS